MLVCILATLPSKLTCDKCGLCLSRHGQLGNLIQPAVLRFNQRSLQPHASTHVQLLAVCIYQCTTCICCKCARWALCDCDACCALRAGRYVFLQFPYIARAMAPLAPVAYIYNSVPFLP
jgi:hypothetical protein